MTAPNHIQYIPSTTFTSSDSLPRIAIPPGSFITVLSAITNVSGTTPSLSIALFGFTKDGSAVSLNAASSVTAAGNRQFQYENAPNLVNVFLSISGTSPSFDVEIDLVITPPASYAA